MTGQIINGYEITKKIGTGGFATVYEAVNPAGFKKAFKVVRPDKAEHNSALYHRFLKEIDMLKQLSVHPNIVKAENVHIHNHTTVLEMEFLDGLDFQEYIKQKAPKGISDISQLKKISKQVLEALDFAHNKEYEYTDSKGVYHKAKGILHLDIKPNNIFRTKDGYLKLLDFGIAKVVGEEAEKIQGTENITMKTETGESTFKGALAYASPEQQAGTTLGITSDIFSFGKTLHFITTGTEDMSIECTVAPFDVIIDKCTQQNPKKRFQTCKEIIDYIDKPQQEEQTECSNLSCKKLIDANVKFCPHCGTEQKKQDVGGEIGGLSKKCPICETKNKTNDSFCSNCGHNFNAPARKRKGKKCPKCNKEYTIADNYCNYCTPATKLVSY